MQETVEVPDGTVEMEAGRSAAVPRKTEAGGWNTWFVGFFSSLRHAYIGPLASLGSTTLVRVLIASLAFCLGVWCFFSHWRRIAGGGKKDLNFSMLHRLACMHYFGNDTTDIQNYNLPRAEHSPESWVQGVLASENPLGKYDVQYNATPEVY